VFFVILRIMQTIQHSIEIHAPKEHVWEALWSDKDLRDWAGIIDRGTYMTGSLQEGGEVNFIGNSEGGVSYGVRSRVDKLIPNTYILFTRIADIVVHPDGSVENRDSQWAGGTEDYKLEEHNGIVALTNTQDVPDELVEYFNAKLPEVLARVKVLAEAK
jgi:uncharacterized protein YndB with AHSA1/START domain